MNATPIKFLKDDTKFVRLADNATRLRALHMYLLLTGAYAPKEQITQQATAVRAIVLGAERPQLPWSKNGDTK